MADLTETRVVIACHNGCGCPYPCPDGPTCRCAALAEDQKKCLFENNCGCKPCSCGPAAAAAENGRFYCRCGPGCTCTTCGA